ncbi:hypothetical protein GCM10020220_107340 [Nonomuraea rubra]|uniref:isochorismatase family protein n=1 Tax=Nonomuraea rubra TaxID=46180 RepID=UPI0031E7518F
MTVSTTLREVNGLNAALPSLSTSTLILIDFQNTYRTGVMALPDADRALNAAARLLERARAAGTPSCTTCTTGVPAARARSRRRAAAFRARSASGRA